MQALEEGLAGERDRVVVDRSLVRRIVSGRIPSDAEAEAAVEALLGVGVVRREGCSALLDLVRLHETEGYRRGVREALSFGLDRERPSVRLCAALPAGLNSASREELGRQVDDLRSALLDVAASARGRIVLASPFWDEETALEMAELLSRRLEAGVAVDILGRFGGQHDGDAALLLARLASFSRCRLYGWYELSPLDPFGVQTFHFKATVADDGAKAYLGTANLTTSGLRSRMELGVVLTGEPARRLSAVVDVALQLARRIEPEVGPLDRRRRFPQ